VLTRDVSAKPLPDKSRSCPACHEPLDGRLETTQLVSADFPFPVDIGPKFTTNFFNEPVDGGRFTSGQFVYSRCRDIEKFGADGVPRLAARDWHPFHQLFS
jgi:hypothetical protein